jgi:hypothetical protein
VNKATVTATVSISASDCACVNKATVEITASDCACVKKETVKATRFGFRWREKGKGDGDSCGTLRIALS